MFALRRWVLRWVLATLAVPVTAEVAERVGRRLEVQGGPSRWSRALLGTSRRLRRFQASRQRRR